jgi:hypothetical protein
MTGPRWWVFPEPPPYEVTALRSGADNSLWVRHEGEWWRRQGGRSPARVLGWVDLIRHYSPLRDATGEEAP